MSTMTEQQQTVFGDARVATETMKARIAPWKERYADGWDEQYHTFEAETGPEVVVTAVYSHLYVPTPHDQWIGVKGRLAAVDCTDGQRTFLVKLPEPVRTDDGPKEEVWAYDVDEVPVDFGDLSLDDVPEPPEEKTPEQQEIDRLKTRVESLESSLTDLRRTHEAFQDQVRDVAIRVAEEESWCDDGLNGVLEELGLEPKKPPMKEVVVEYRVTYRACADSGDVSWWESSLSREPDFDTDPFDSDVEDVEMVNSETTVVSVEYIED